jgi:hypothetical protein
MRALLATLAALGLGAAPPAPPEPPPLQQVQWVVGPRTVAIGGGRVRVALPPGVAIAAGSDARAVFEAIAGGADGSELGVLSPVSAQRSWFVVLSWWSGGEEGPSTVTGTAADGQRVVNRSAIVRLRPGAVLATLVSPLGEAGEAGALFDRIVGGLRAGDPGVAREACAVRPAPRR